MSFTFSCSSCVSSDFSLYSMIRGNTRIKMQSHFFANFKLSNIKIFLIAVAFSYFESNSCLSPRWLYLGYNSQFFTVPHDSCFSYTLFYCKISAFKSQHYLRYEGLQVECDWNCLNNTSENRSTTNNKLVSWIKIPCVQEKYFMV